MTEYELLQIQIVVKNARLLQHDEKDKNRHQHARDKLQEAETDVRKLIKELEDVLADHDLKGKALKAELGHRQAKSDTKGKGRMLTDANDSEYDDDDDDEGDEEELGVPKTPAGDEYRVKRRAIKQRLREGFLLLHKVKFLQGDVYHVLGKSPEEDAAYQVAEELRHRLLKGMNFLFSSVPDV
jgi:E3 ubiquitin-protein ligase SHPRH